MAESIAIRRASAVERTPLIAAALSIPVSFGAYYNFELNPAYLLAPFIAYAMWQSREEWTTRIFVVSGVCGLISVVAVHLMSPGNLKGTIVELLAWMLFAPSFLFLGRLIPLKPLVYWTAVLSASFLIIITLPLLATGEPVRAIYSVMTNGHGIGTSYINVTFFGLPVYATFGVNSITPLFCLQAALICGGIYTARPLIAAFLSAGLMCAVVLIVESDSRTGQATLIMLCIAVASFAIWRRDLRKRSIAVAAALILATPVVALRGMGESRLIVAVYDTVGLVKTEEQSTPNGSEVPPVFDSTAGDEEGKNIATVTTGRTTLWQAAIADLKHSPFFGNGFAAFGRFFPAPNAEGNTTTHFYYLTIPWKGGVIFAVPFFAFIGLALYSAWRARNRSPEWYFAATGVALMFLLPSLTWDILMIPSAGALAWLILGSLRGAPVNPTKRS